MGGLTAADSARAATFRCFHFSAATLHSTRTPAITEATHCTLNRTALSGLALLGGNYGRELGMTLGDGGAATGYTPPSDVDLPQCGQFTSMPFPWSG